MKYFAVFSLIVMLVPRVTFAADPVIDIAFPIDGEATYSDDFDDQRAGHVHHAIDMLAPKMTRILATVDGRIDFAPMDEPSYGYMISLDGDDGFEYNYIHINNDTPGTDDGNGGTQYAYAPGISRGVRVERGQFIAYVGDSGNAEDVGPHLHFEIYDGDTAINPYASLKAAEANISYNFDPEAEKEAATSIAVDKEIPTASGETACVAGSLIRTDEFSTVYYCGQDGGRYVFQNEGTFFSWYANFDSVTWISREAMASLQIKGVVTYKPGTYLLKLPSSPKVYAVGHNGSLHYVSSATAAEELYGVNWAKLVRDLPESFFPAYDVGEDVVRN